MTDRTSAVPQQFVLCQRSSGTHEIKSASEVHLERLRDAQDCRSPRISFPSLDLVTYLEQREEADGVRKDWEASSEALVNARRRRRARRVRADRPGEGERRRLRAIANFDRMMAEAKAARRAEDQQLADEWDWPVDAWQLLDALDDLDLGLFVAVHEPTYLPYDLKRRRHPQFSGTDDLRNLLTRAVKADPDLIGLIRDRARERLGYQTERFLEEHHKDRQAQRPAGRARG